MKKNFDSNVLAVRCLVVRFQKRLYPPLMILLFMLGVGKSLNTVNAQCDIVVTLMEIEGQFINFCVSSADQQTIGNWTISHNNIDYPIDNASGGCIMVPYMYPAFFLVKFEGHGFSCTEQAILGISGCPDVLYTTSYGSCGAVDITVNLAPEEVNFPYTIDFGDGTIQIVNDENFNFTHVYPCDEGPFNVCVTFSTNEDTLSYVTCCRPVAIPDCGCCNTADFSIQEVSPDPPISCLSLLYEITPICTTGGVNEHKWEFEDGTVFYGPTVPLHHFTDFVNNNEEVWVRHTVTCCGTTLVVEKTIDFTKGAFLGWPNEDRKFSKILPPAPWNGNINITVREFLQNYSQNSNVPLFIDGRLIGDQGAYFAPDPNKTMTWNMGKNSSIEIQGLQTISRNFTLNDVTIQSPIRLSSSYSDCCRWNGIKSSRRTNLNFHGSQITDAEIMLEYISAGTSVPLPASSPRIDFVTNHFENNKTLIKSDGFPFAVTKFEDNTIIGRVENPIICDCIANNAFDLRNIAPTIAFPFTLTNDVTAYEQGFHLENTKLDVKGFNLHDLGNCMGVNGDIDDGIGISFAWTKPTTSLLTLDHLKFENMVTGVREDVSAGKHWLTGIASVPVVFNPATNVASLKMVDVEKGYDIELTGAAITNARITGNDIATDGGAENFGVSVMMASQNNSVLAEANQVVCGGNSTSIRGIEVINTATLGAAQDVKVLNNRVDAEGIAGSGAGVLVARANSAKVSNNVIEVANDFNGIEVGQSSAATISCNNITGANDGIMVNTNEDMTVAKNTISVSFDNSLDVMGDCFNTGSKIWWNDFGFSLKEGVFFSKDGTVTGVQHHKKYNSWQPNIFENELKHIKAAEAILSQFWRPLGDSQGSIHFPKSEPGIFMLAAPAGPAEEPPFDYCGGDISVEIPEPDPEEMAARHAEIIDGLTGVNGNDGAQVALMQSEYGFLLDNPGWKTFEPSIDAFYTAQSSGFVGQSVQVQRQMLALQQTMLLQHNSRQPLNTVRDSLLGVLDWIAGQAEQTTDPTVLTSLEAQANAIQTQIEAIELSLSTMLATAEAANAIEMTNLQSANALLPDTAIYMANERKVNELTLKHWAQQTLTEQEAGILRGIAQTCYELTGRSGFMARTLCLVALGEYYRELECPTAEPRTKPTPSNIDRSLHISPNPVSGLLTLMLDPGWSNEDISISIFDAVGREVLFSAKGKDETSMMQLDASKLAPGLYCLKASNEERSETILFAVQR